MKKKKKKAREVERRGNKQRISESEHGEMVERETRERH